MQEEAHESLSTCCDLQAQRTIGNEASRGRKEQTVQNDIHALELALESAKAELDKIGSRNRKVKQMSKIVCHNSDICNLI